MVKRVIYPATRAVEHAIAQPGVRPVRFFPVLWPLWEVQTTAEIHDEQAFEIIDHFLLRAVDEADLHDPARLAGFLGLPPGIVDRCLRFLTMIGHVTIDGGGVRLTPLGRQSLQAGVRLVPKTSSQTLYFERQTGRPLPRRYYDAKVPFLDRPEVAPEQLADGTRFLSVFTVARFQPEWLTWLESNPQRADYNLPGLLRDLRQDGQREAYLPSYLIETADRRILAYTACSGERDDFLEQVYHKTTIGSLIEAQGVREPAETWNRWLSNSAAFGRGKLRHRGDLWQVTLPADAFGDHPKVSLSRLGGYQFRENHFIQVWCDDAATRKQALAQRCRGIARQADVSSVTELVRRVQALADTLEVPHIDLAQLRREAERANDHACLHSLRLLETGAAGRATGQRAR
ncbi:hypothetical protein CS0771_48070 [Catellatospora sp. IY07-71]|uniref:hypothetical protein n=1 Tax=Catellatospora sp. IY07-71 TaxID=2728827 RepID=UPI001BB3C5AE|nr:hypothetical protein [Catellatospora sp. IY07-71]BCJ75263.1 hypothetical protein CS0771_48070 [Catellatospora sp. IY07-71]